AQGVGGRARRAEHVGTRRGGRILCPEKANAPNV
ncbi:MAG: hypothetical protein AVDCRST_MAG89-3680, partial [uncultured Gemmatimonadetes bacterium]